MTSKKQTFLFTKDTSTYSAAASLVNPTARRENDLENKTNAIYGQKCLEQFEKLNRGTWWAKTYAALLIGMGAWYSTRCNLTWKLKGTKSKRLYFQLAASMPRTKEIGSSSSHIMLPTPRTTDVEGGKMSGVKNDGNGWYRENKKGERWGVKLRDVVENGLLKTPTAMDGHVVSGKKNPTSGDSGTLAQEIMSGYQPTMEKLKIPMNEMLPTPMHQEGDKITGKENQDSLTKRARQIAGKTSQLNPLFVAEMMGFPVNWTVLPFQNGEKKV